VSVSILKSAKFGVTVMSKNPWGTTHNSIEFSRFSFH